MLITEGADLRGCEQSTRAISLYSHAKKNVGCNDDKKIRFCIDKYDYLNLSLEEIQEEFKNRRLSEKYPYVTHRIICCESCHCGCSSVPSKEIEEQRTKYGTYICVNCEKAAKNIADAKFGDCRVSGKQALITKDGIYYDDGICMDERRSFLGFAGRWFIITEHKEIRPEGTMRKLNNKTGEWEPYTYKQSRTYLTNNLFIARGLHEKLLPVYEDKINAEIKCVEKKYLMDLKEQLNKYVCFKE